jgi:hypothetical protein
MVTPLAWGWTRAESLLSPTKRYSNAKTPVVEGWNHTQIAAEELLKCGVPQKQIIVAGRPDVETQRAFASALAVVRKLEQQGIMSGAVNVFTFGSHSQRSKLVYEKAFLR